jgi:hypothetical protein
VNAVLQGLDEQLAVARKWRFVPVLTTEVAYGDFGGGIGTTYDNFGPRLDANVQVVYNLTDLFHSGPNRRVFQAKRSEQEITRAQVLQKMRTGVRVQADQYQSAKSRISEAEQDIKRIIEQYGKVREIQSNFGGAENQDKGSQIVNLLTLEANTIGQLAKARTAYLESVLDANKAQVTLKFLLGPAATPAKGADSESPKGSKPSPQPAPAGSAGVSQKPGLNRQPILQPVRNGGSANRRGVWFPRVDDKVP